MSDITIRNAALADAPRILEIYAYYVEHTVITFEYDVPSLAEFEGRMRDIMQKYPYLVIVRDGRIEGYAYAHAFVGRAAYDWAAELTIYLDHDARRGGLGRTLYEALADRLKGMGILNLYARIGYPQKEDVNRVSIRSVRQACAYVPQDNFLFSDTIAHNIAFGVDEASPEDIERAARLADVRDNIVDFKDGYETVLGERGVTVSGGQKQRISIARALLKDAPILILDDSVSAVDTRTEKIILDNLKKSRAGKTTLLIAHRISTVEGLDKIVFLEDGRVEAVGPHDQLYASCPEYRRMVDLQKLEDEVGGGNA